MKRENNAVIAKMIIFCLIVLLTGCASHEPLVFNEHAWGVERTETRYTPISTSFNVDLKKDQKNNQYESLSLIKTGVCKIEKRKIFRKVHTVNKFNWKVSPVQCSIVGILIPIYGWYKCTEYDKGYQEAAEGFITGEWTDKEIYNEADIQLFLGLRTLQGKYGTKECTSETMANKDVQITLFNKEKTDAFWKLKEKTNDGGTVNFLENQKKELTLGLSKLTRKGNRVGIIAVTSEGIGGEVEIDAASHLPFEQQLYVIGPKDFSLGHIIEHLAEGMSEKIIISKIKKSKTAYRDFSMKEVKILQMIDVSDDIIQAMIDVTDPEQKSSPTQNVQTDSQGVNTQSVSQTAPAEKEGLDDKIAGCIAQTATLKLCGNMSWSASMVCETAALSGGNKCF